MNLTFRMNTLVFFCTQLFCLGLAHAKEATIAAIKGLDLEIVEINIETKLLSGSPQVGRVERQFPIPNGESNLKDPREAYAELQKLQQKSLELSSTTQNESILQEQLFLRRNQSQMINELASIFELKAQGIVDGVDGFFQRQLPKLETESPQKAKSQALAASGSAQESSNEDSKNEIKSWVNKSHLSFNENEISTVEFKSDGQFTKKNLYFHTFKNSPMKLGISWDHVALESKTPLDGRKNLYLRQHMIANCREAHSYYTYLFTSIPIRSMEPEIRLICQLPAQQGYIKFRVHRSEFTSQYMNTPKTN